MTILEAMSYGMPIITTNVGGISELVTPNVEGIFTNGSEESIVEAINIIKNNYKLMSKNAIQKSFNYDHFKINEIIWNELNKYIK